MSAPTHTEFRDAVGRLHREKDAAYRDAWKKRGEVLSVLANIARKVDWLEHVLDGAPTTRDGSPLDTAVDLFVYALKCQTARQGSAEALMDATVGLIGALSREIPTLYGNFLVSCREGNRG
ncbi:MAG: hypothetical protein ACRD0K_18645 [Egibacteraceae bacterium]